MAYKIDTSVFRDSIPDFTRGLDALGEGLSVRRDRQRQAKRDRAAELMEEAQREQMKTSAERQAEELEIKKAAEARAKQQDEFEEKKTLADASETITGMLGTGEVSKARARAEMLGGKLDENRPDVPEVRAPEVLQLREPEPKRPGPEDPSLLAGRQLSSMFPVARTPDESREVGKLDQVGEDLAAQREAAGKPSTFILNLGDQEIELNPAAEISEKRKAEAQDFRETTGKSLAELGPEGETLAELGASLIESLPPGADRKAIDSYIANFASQLTGRRVSEVDRFKASEAEKRSKINASAIRNKGLDEGDVSKNRLPFLKEARTEVEQLLGQQDFSTARDEYIGTRTMLQDLQSGNDAQVRRALGLWAKQAAGPGAVQEAERDEFVRNVGGKIQGIEQKVNEWIKSGEVPKLPPEQLQIFVDALEKTMIKRTDDRIGQIESVVRDAFEKSPIPELRRPEYVDYAVRQVTGVRRTAPKTQVEEEKKKNDEVDGLIMEALGG